MDTSPKSPEHAHADSISAYLDLVETITSKWSGEICANNDIPEEDKPTMKYFFRGHACKDWLLRPSLFRKLPCAMDGMYEYSIENNSYYKQEQFIIQEAIRLHPEAFERAKTDIERMAICQHYALPTRLLDVSGSALVALYFAVVGKKDCDGIVYIFRSNAAEYNIASTGGKVEIIHISNYQNDGSGPISVNGKPVLVFPTQMTSRQKAQEGCFFLMENKCKPFDLIEFPNDCYRKIVIPQEYKEVLENQLESLCNIHESALFPETLDSSVNKLKREAEMRIKAETVN